MEDESIRLWGSTADDAESHSDATGDSQYMYHQSLPLDTVEPKPKNRRHGLERRLSDPAVNARQALTSTHKKGKKRRKRQPAATPPPPPPSPAVTTRNLYTRAASPSSVQSSKSSPSSLEDGLQQVQVRWADDHPHQAYANRSHSTSTGFATSFATSSTASSSISEISSPLPLTNKMNHHFNNSQASALTLPTSTTTKKHKSARRPSRAAAAADHSNLHHSGDGFGKVVKSPQAQRIVKTAANMASPSSRRRTNRNVEPDLRLSQHDPFVPVDDLFGDFANIQSASQHTISDHMKGSNHNNHNSNTPTLDTSSKNNRTGSMNQYDDDDDDDGEDSSDDESSSDEEEKIEEDYPIGATKTNKPRLWASMSHISPNQDEGAGTGLATIGETKTIKSSTDHGTTGGGATKPATTTTTKLKNGASLKGIMKRGNNGDSSTSNTKQPQHSKGMSGSRLVDAKTSGGGGNSKSKQIELAPTNIISTLSSPAVKSNNNSSGGSKHNSFSDLAASSPKPTAKKTKKKKEKQRRRNSDPIQLKTALVARSNVELSPKTVATTGMMSAATTNTTSTSAATNIRDTKIISGMAAVTSKDDLFLLAMEKFAAKAELKAAKKELKVERSKLKKGTRKSLRKKIKKKIMRRRLSWGGEEVTRRRLSLGGEEELFNVEDNTEFFGESANVDDDIDDDLAALLSSPDTVKAHYVEIEWSPPAFVKEDLVAKAKAEGSQRMARRASAPGSSANEPYEPVTPTFVYDKKKRRPSKRGESVVPASLVPPFPLDDDNVDFMEETATAVDTVLNQDSVGSFNENVVNGFGGRRERRLSVAESMQLLDQMDQSKSWLMSHKSHSEGAFRPMDRDPDFTAGDPMLDISSKSAAEPRRSFAPQMSSSRTKTKRRGSTSVLEMSARSTVSHSSRGEDKKPPRPKTARPGDKNGRRRSRSKSPHTPSSATRSKSKSSASRTQRRGGTPERASESPARRDRRSSSKQPSSSRRRATSRSPDPKLRESRSKSPESRAMARSEKSSASPRSSHHSDKKPKRKTSDGKSSSKNPSRRRASMPAPQRDPQRGLDRSKRRSKSRQREQTNSLSQSQSSLSKEKSRQREQPNSLSHPQSSLSKEKSRQREQPNSLSHSQSSLSREKSRQREQPNSLSHSQSSLSKKKSRHHEQTNSLSHSQSSLSKEKLRQREQTNSLSQSQSSLSKEKEKKGRSKSSNQKIATRRSTMSHSKSPRPQKKSKSPKPKREKRRASLSSIEAARPQNQPLELSSWSALTADSAELLRLGGTKTSLLDNHHDGEVAS